MTVLISLLAICQSKVPPPPFFLKWPTSLDEYDEFMDSIVSTNADIASHVSYPQRTSQGRLIRGVRIAAAAQRTSNETSVVWLQGQVHPDEWIAGMTAAWIIYQLCEERDMNLLGQVEFHVFPVVNRDGYVYTLSDPGNSTVRLWVKSRTPNFGSECLGTNLNRNGPVGFATTGSSPDPCDESFRGTAPLSDPTTASIAMYGESLKTRLLWFADIHCCVPSWTSVWGYTDALPSDYEYIYGFLEVAKAAVDSVHGSNIQIGTAARVIGLAGGGMDELVYGSFNQPLSFTIECRGNSSIQDASQVVPSGEEVFAGVVAMTRRALTTQPPQNKDRAVIIALSILCAVMFVSLLGIIAAFIFHRRRRSANYGTL